MPRPPRPAIASGVYHVFNRGNRRADIFREESDFEHFWALLQEIGDRYGWPFFAFCLMTNHFHLVVETPEADISAGLHRLSFLYAQYFNRKYSFDGHVFQGRFKTRVVLSEMQLLSVIRYVVTNPLRAGICDRAEEWRWSSYRATVGIRRAPRFLSVDRVLRHFGADRALARTEFAAYVREAEEAIRSERRAASNGVRSGQGRGPDPWAWLDQPMP
jgi:putative transposase